MLFDRDEARRIAGLARLELTDAELEEIAAQLGSVLDHVAALEENGSLPSDGTAGPVGGLRSDAPVHDPLARPPAGFAPAWSDGFFTVPRLKAFQAVPQPDPADE